MVWDYLGQHGFDVQIEHRGSVAADRIVQEQPDMVVLDLGLPGRDGLDICREVRPCYVGPILILAARGNPVDEVVGLEIGADDYLAKPAHPRVLLARLRAPLRRTAPGDPAVGSRRQHGKLVVDAANRVVTWAGRAVALSSTGFNLVWLLALASGRVVGRDEIYQQLRGIGYDGLDRSIDLRIHACGRSWRMPALHRRWSRRCVASDTFSWRNHEPSLAAFCPGDRRHADRLLDLRGYGL